MNNTLKVLASILLTLFFLFLALKNVEIKDVWLSLQDVSYGVLVLASLMALFSIALRAVRWRIILAPLKLIPFNTVLSFTMIGFMTNNVLPAHAGEFVKPYLLGKKEHLSLVSLLTTVLVERILDSMALVTLFAFTMLLLPVPSWLQSTGAAVGIFSVLSVYLLINLSRPGSRLRSLLLRWSQKTPRRFRESLQNKLETVFQSLTSLNDPRNLVGLFLLSLLIWLELAATIYVILITYPLASGADQNLMLASVFVIVVLAFAVVLPSSPGYIGITQLAFQMSLAFFGIGDGDALGVSVVFHLTQYIPITLVGIAFLLKEGLGFRELNVKRKSADSYV